MHLIFKRYEPHRVAVHALLLVAVPAFLSLLLLDRMPVTQALSVSTLTFWTALISSVTVYRLSPWHPLAHYPGPLFLRLSKMSMAWVSRGGRRHLYTQELHRRYGDVVRVGE